MGVIQVWMKVAPEGTSAKEFAEQTEKFAVESLRGQSYDSCDCDVLKLDDFNEQWSLQDNIEDTDAMRDKYRQLTQEGRVVVLEIDW